MLHKGGDMIIDVSKNQQYILLPELTYKFPGKNSGNDTKKKLLGNYKQQSTTIVFLANDRIQVLSSGLCRLYGKVSIFMFALKM